MKILKDVLICVLLSAVSALFVFLVVLVRDADKTVKAVPAEITAARSALTAEIDATRTDLLATVNTQATAIRKTADRRLGSIQKMVDNRTAQALQIADARLTDATAQVAKVQTDLHPVLANAASLTKDAQDSLDDSYWDLKALIESADVATTSIAQTSETVRNAAPQVAASVEGIAKSADGIAQNADGVAKDVKREAISNTARPGLPSPREFRSTLMT